MGFLGCLYTVRFRKLETDAEEVTECGKQMVDTQPEGSWESLPSFLLLTAFLSLATCFSRMKEHVKMQTADGVSSARCSGHKHIRHQLFYC